MAEIPASWLAIITALVAALIASVAYVWKSRDSVFKEQIARLDKEVAAGRLKIDELQDRALENANKLTDSHKIAAETYRRLAESLEDQNATLEKAMGIKR